MRCMAPPGSSSSPGVVAERLRGGIAQTGGMPRRLASDESERVPRRIAEMPSIMAWWTLV